METQTNQVHDENLFVNNNEIRAYLMETAKWGRFLAIVGYVGLGLILLIAVFMLIASGAAMGSKFSGSGFSTMGLMVIYLVFGAVYYFPITYLFKYSTSIRVGLESNDLSTISSAFANLKSLFKFMGICTIVVLSIYALILIVVVPFALMR